MGAGWQGVAHSKAHRSLQGCAWPGLAADVVEGEQQVVVLGHAGGKTQFELLVELGRPARAGQGALLGAALPPAHPMPLPRISHSIPAPTPPSPLLALAVHYCPVPPTPHTCYDRPLG